MSTSTHELREVMGDPRYSDKMFLFLQNVFHLYPEAAFHALIRKAAEESPDDEAAYAAIAAGLPTISPFLGMLTYGLPALKKQKRVICEQTLRLLSEWRARDTPIDGWVEIGTVGRYLGRLRGERRITGDLVLVNDVAPTSSIGDIMERGQIGALGRFVSLDDYAPLSPHTLPDASVDVVTCVIGLHHAAADRIHGFVNAIARVLRPGGLFIVRDHDAASMEMFRFCSAIHTVFNVGTGVPWSANAAEVRRFNAIEGWVTYLEAVGFVDGGRRLLQDHDPSDNVLVGLVKR